MLGFCCRGEDFLGDQGEIHRYACLSLYIDDGHASLALHFSESRLRLQNKYLSWVAKHLPC